VKNNINMLYRKIIKGNGIIGKVSNVWLVGERLNARGNSIVNTYNGVISAFASIISRVENGAELMNKTLAKKTITTCNKNGLVMEVSG